jgi:F-type H+-transporting ATPase subunit alpha
MNSEPTAPNTGVVVGVRGSIVDMRFDGASTEQGQRIRACLGHVELSPVSAPAQSAILLVLDAGMFDPVPLEQMVAAQQAVQAAADTLSADLLERLTQGDELTPADRKQVTEAARRSIATFLAQAAQAAHPADAAQEPAT